MTEDQVRTWKAKRDEAKKLADPHARELALDVVYDMKDDMQLDCQRKMADRIKELKASDKDQSDCLASVKSSVEQVERDFKQHMKSYEKDHEFIEEAKAGKLKVAGAMTMLKLLGYLLAGGGGFLVKLVLDIVNKAGGVQ